jgi:hypothetical protein
MSKERELIKKKVEIEGKRVRMVLYIENINLVCEVYVDGEFVEKFIVNVLQLFQGLKS